MQNVFFLNRKSLKKMKVNSIGLRTVHNIPPIHCGVLRETRELVCWWTHYMAASKEGFRYRPSDLFPAQTYSPGEVFFPRVDYTC